jgi:hypothetical protein
MTETESFERAFIATAYLLGRRDELTSHLARPTAAATLVVERLAHGDRNERARRLATEIRPIAEALDARSLR